MSNLEQTLSIIKPDAVERKLENEIKVINNIITILFMRVNVMSCKIKL